MKAIKCSFASERRIGWISRAVRPSDMIFFSTQHAPSQGNILSMMVICIYLAVAFIGAGSLYIPSLQPCRFSDKHTKVLGLLKEAKKTLILLHDSQFPIFSAHCLSNVSSSPSFLAECGLLVTVYMYNKQKVPCCLVDT